MRGIVTIDINTAAWIAAVGAAGAAVVGTAILWPVMKRVLRKYDERMALPKDGDAVKIEVEEDTFQKKVAAALRPNEVEPNDKSLGAYFKRAQ